MNWLNWIMGRKVTLVGCIRKDQGFPIPAVYLGIRHWWFDTSVDIMDCVSFLIVAEKIAEAKDGDFIYNKMHETTEYKLEIPAWALETVQMRCAIVAPMVYEGLKKSDEKNEELAKEMGAEWESKAREWSAVGKYKRLHAQVNGYPLPQEKDDTKVLH